MGTPTSFEQLTPKQQEFLTCKPSRLIEMALDDLVSLAETPGYEIDMGSWVSVTYKNPANGYQYCDEDVTPEMIAEKGMKVTCYVCLGGAALVGCGYQGSWRSTSYTRELIPYFNGHNLVARGRIMALNDFRVGRVTAGINCMNLYRMPDQPDYYEDPKMNRYVPTWRGDPLEFEATLRGLIADLRTVGL